MATTTIVTKDGSEITVSIWHDGKQWMRSVKMKGRGIDGSADLSEEDCLALAKLFLSEVS